MVGRLTVVPITAEVCPGRVYRFDECNLLRASPAFEFFLSRDRRLHILATLEPNQTIAVVTRGEPVMLPPFVLEDTLHEIARHPGVKRMTAAGHDVGAVGAFVHEHIVRLQGWRCEKQPQILRLRLRMTGMTEVAVCPILTKRFVVRAGTQSAKDPPVAESRALGQRAHHELRVGGNQRKKRPRGCLLLAAARLPRPNRAFLLPNWEHGIL